MGQWPSFDEAPDGAAFGEDGDRGAGAVREVGVQRDAEVAVEGGLEIVGRHGVQGGFFAAVVGLADLEIKNGRQLTRTFTGIPAEEHYITLQNGSPGLTDATLWVNGKVVSRGSVTDGQVVTLNVADRIRPGKRNTVRITATGPKGAKAVLLIGDASLAGGGASTAASAAGRLNTDFSR